MSVTLNCIQWMVNQEDQSPCVTAQEVGQLCNQGYTVSLTNFQESSYVPGATTANGCTCSWSIYNLLSACSYCVGQRQYTSWSAWTTNCGSYTSNTSYLPSRLGISQGIPFWAATNPFTWVNATFNVTQAADIAEEAQPDVTGGPLPTSTTSITSTTSTSSSSGVSVGMIVGLVIVGIAIIVTGGLVIVCAIHRRRRKRVHPRPTTDLPIDGFHSGVAPSIRNQTPVQPTSSRHSGTSFVPITPYVISPTHSMTSLAPTSFLSPVSAGFSSNGRSALPVTDAADVISPFLVPSSSRQMNRANTSTNKAAEVVSERVLAPPGQRARLNPPPYSASIEPELSELTTTWERRLSMRKQKGSVSGATAHLRHSRTESANTTRAGTRTEQSRSRIASPGLVTDVSTSGGSVDGVGDVGMAHSSERADHLL